jgi:transcriptional regulator of acetoin/glycerol metabolism
MQLLTKKDVANRCKMPVKWVEKAASSGKIPSPVYLDGHKRWREKDIDEWIQAGCLPIPKPEIKQVDVQLFEGNLNLEQIEKAAIIRALNKTKGNREKAARLLGKGERTIYRKIKDYGLG